MGRDPIKELRRGRTWQELVEEFERVHENATKTTKGRVYQRPLNGKDRVGRTRGSRRCLTCDVGKSTTYIRYASYFKPRFPRYVYWRIYYFECVPMALSAFSKAFPINPQAR